MRRLSDFFTEPTAKKYLFYLITLIYVLATSFVVVVEPFVSLPCDLEQREENHNKSLDFENILYQYSDCDFQRYAKLLYLCRSDCLRGRHLLMAGRYPGARLCFAFTTTHVPQSNVKFFWAESLGEWFGKIIGAIRNGTHNEDRFERRSNDRPAGKVGVDDLDKTLSSDLTLLTIERNSNNGSGFARLRFVYHKFHLCIPQRTDELG